MHQKFPSLEQAVPFRHSGFEYSDNGPADHVHSIHEAVQLVFKRRIGGGQEILTVLRVHRDQQIWEAVIQHALEIRGRVLPDIARLVLRHGTRAVDRNASLAEAFSACSDDFLQVDIAQHGGMQTAAGTSAGLAQGATEHSATTPVEGRRWRAADWSRRLKLMHEENELLKARLAELDPGNTDLMAARPARSQVDFGDGGTGSRTYLADARSTQI